MRAALDREGQNFLTYVESVAREKGHPHHPHLTEEGENNDNNNNKHWVEFDSLFEMADQKRAVVAQAFYHVLSLATKNVLRVRQDGQGGNEPFGAIHLGVDVSMVGIGDGGESGVEEGMEMD
jgi:meiotic recombination protein REC8, fungi type